MSKKHAPIEQLREAYDFAMKRMAELGVVAPGDASVIDSIFKDKDAPILPGVPAYLPYSWTIDVSLTMLSIITTRWIRKNRKKDVIINNIDSFFKFVVGELDKEEARIISGIRDTVDKEVYDTKLLYKRDSLRGVRQFLIDSFAVSIVSKSNDDVPSYLEWVADWSNQLKSYWRKKEESQDGKESDRKDTSATE
jgi:hypothetical protein